MLYLQNMLSPPKCDTELQNCGVVLGHNVPSMTQVTPEYHQSPESTGNTLNMK